ncbi:MAG: ABC transporter ATP-binding protein [Planctomycetota bacterium]|nr:MAG: ABC transporter ATP-binding protein [Planctomycetota bacterium]
MSADLSTSAAPPAAKTATRHALEVRGIAKEFQVGSETLHVLRGIDLSIPYGQPVALVGSSGAGKSTLLHIAGLLERPTSGEVRVDGVEGWALAPDARALVRNRKIGFVFQFYHLLSELSALENVLLPAMISHSPSEWRGEKAKLTDAARALLARFGLEARMRHRPAQLSGGERQRVALARALLHDPPILIADEPTGNLDTATGEKVLELLFDEQRTRHFAMLLVTHDPKLAARCPRTVRMQDGRIVGDTNGATS